MDPTCNAAVTLESDQETWVITCLQEMDHPGPHVGPLTWED